VKEKYVCAFRGRRDSYQVPVALAEAGMLDQFITDAYATPLVRLAARFAPETVRLKVDFRSQPSIKSEYVRCLWGTTVFEHLRHRMGCAPIVTFNKLDRNFALAAARRATRTHSHLFLYSPYAWEAFTAHYSHTPKKVLFQFHPHPELEKRILAADSARHPDAGESFSGGATGQLPEELVWRERDCWKYADLIFCASTFTKRSLLDAGADESKCRVVPYGIEVPGVAEGLPPNEAFHVVFAGSGGQRKGLHHLLVAWQRATLPASSKLTIVCRVIDRGIESLAATTPRVELRRGVVQRELNHIFASSTLFVMPSLVEGFGQVYLEALAQGCPVLGTNNTCLPDIGFEKDGVYTVSPGNIDELIAKIESLSKELPSNHQIREAARACAARFPWCRFRKNLRQNLGV
jgi:glycosyltransferase involved in cell wall biosynthesis